MIEVDPVLRQTVKWSQYKKVPILLAEVTDGYQQLNDSSMIISVLATLLNDNQKDLRNIVKYYPVVTYNEDNSVKSEILNKYFLMREGALEKSDEKNQISAQRIM